MTTDELLDTLGYRDSSYFLQPGSTSFEFAPNYGHIFRHAAVGGCHLTGVYTLRQPNSTPERIVPVVYVCQADSEASADYLHRYVWNQDVVPFALVHTGEGVKLFSGFRYGREQSEDEQRGVLHALTPFDAVLEEYSSFRAQSINNGQLWQQWGGRVAANRRVSWSLLRNLQRVGQWLQRAGGLVKKVSHALIGKYVYLHYLRDREILSREKFHRWGIDPLTVFGSNATRAGLATVIEQLDGWLNGGVFPISFEGKGSPADEHVQRVAGIFSGDDIDGQDWQMHLDFRAYDFSYIPIETLSMVYERFLHSPDPEPEVDVVKPEDVVTESEDEEGSGRKKTKGKKAGAYYTPIPLVNFMLSEVEEHQPLRAGMKVFDPACGSGAFLVQCYRRLIEKVFVSADVKADPDQLRDLLCGSIYGVDLDGDACAVTELSLLLTLLDYVDPPDLEDYLQIHPSFRLPTLRGTNIFKMNFFQEQPTVSDVLGGLRFDWVVGNPPFNHLVPKRADAEEKVTLSWMGTHTHECPVGGYQIAQAFAWASPLLLKEGGICALLLPAMFLVEDLSKTFRAQFFKHHRVYTVANLANLANFLFAGRARVAVAACFYAPRVDRKESAHIGEEHDENGYTVDEHIIAFCPLLANQESTRGAVELVEADKRTRPEIWSLVVNASEVREVALEDVLSGDGLPWKLVAWGSPADSRLLKKVSARWPSLGTVEAPWVPGQKKFIAKHNEQVLGISQGLELRDKSSAQVELVREIEGKKHLRIRALNRLRNIFSFPADALKLRPKHKYFRLRSGLHLPLTVCQPPHVIVHAARTFAVYSDDFIVLPGRQIGIISMTKDIALLKALSLYLSSDFAFYHQFLTSTEFGIKRDRATLDALRQIPVPFAGKSPKELSPWVELHDKLAKTRPSPLRQPVKQAEQVDLLDTRYEESPDHKPLLEELNGMVASTLGLNERDQALVYDLVHVRLQLNEGRLGDPAMRKPTTLELNAYAQRMKQELDSFVRLPGNRQHRVTVVRGSLSGMVNVDIVQKSGVAMQVRVFSEEDKEGRALWESPGDLLRKDGQQWVYFERNLRLYEDERTFVLKPYRRFHWTESQAMLDAQEIIADNLSDAIAAEK